MRWRGSRASGEVTYFVNRINNFIFREFTGEIEDDLPVTIFTQGDAGCRASSRTSTSP